jgi:DNA-binding CsgD family transcriptional regulator
LIKLRLGGDDLPRRLLAAALEWSAERLGTVVGGCALFSPRHEPVAWAWGSAHAVKADDLIAVAERLQYCLLPPGEASSVALRVDADPAQPPALLTEAEEPGGCAAALGRHGLGSPRWLVLRVEGRVSGLIWLAAEGPAVSSPTDANDDLRVLRLAQPLLELALRDRWYQARSEVALGGDLAGRGLTRRQEAIARLAVAGLANREIASHLGLSERTIKNHMTGVLAKCGVRSRTQLIALYGLAADAT